MSKNVDVSIAFYGKPYHTIVAIKTLVEQCGHHIDKIYLTQEYLQPHNDYSGIFKVIDYFKGDATVRLEILRPKYFVHVGIADYELVKQNDKFRRSIMFQWPLEITDKKYLLVSHNDMLYHKDIVGDMLQIFQRTEQNVMGVGSVGQCWSCPAGPHWGNKCDSKHYEEFVPTKEEAIALTQMYDTPRRNLQLKVINEGRVHMLPECRLNEYCALIDVEKYRKETLPTGDLGCYGGSWGGVDLGTVWSHEIYKRGYRFMHIPIDEYATHSPFDITMSGTKAKTHLEVYLTAERNAEQYIKEKFGPIQFSPYVLVAGAYSKLKRGAWMSTIHTYGIAKKVLSKTISKAFWRDLF